MLCLVEHANVKYSQINLETKYRHFWFKLLKIILKKNKQHLALSIYILLILRASPDARV